MRSDKLYRSLVAKMQEVTVVPPQTVGPLTSIYKRIALQFKVNPWKTALIVSLSISLLAYILLGVTLVKITSLLQYGF